MKNTPQTDRRPCCFSFYYIPAGRAASFKAEFSKSSGCVRSLCGHSPFLPGKSWGNRRYRGYFAKTESTMGFASLLSVKYELSRAFTITTAPAPVMRLNSRVQVKPSVHEVFQ